MARSQIQTGTTNPRSGANFTTDRPVAVLMVYLPREVEKPLLLHYQEGMSRREACLRGVSEIGFAITIATTTTLIVFCSTMLIQGRMKFMIQTIMPMAFFFESTLIPLSIILTIPLASIGAVSALKVSNIYIDHMVYMGALLLVGIVVNNGIVLVDYANRLRRSGCERSEALLLAARHRFRPVVMTALTTICGMIPLTFGSSEEMGVNFKSFGMVLIGGMTSATLFTLLAVPVFYTLIEDAQKALGNILASVFNRSPRPSAEPPSIN